MAGSHWRHQNSTGLCFSGECLLSRGPRGQSLWKSFPVTLRGAEGAREWPSVPTTVHRCPGAQDDVSGGCSLNTLTQRFQQAQKPRHPEQLCMSFFFTVVTFDIQKGAIELFKTNAVFTLFHMVTGRPTQELCINNVYVIPIVGVALKRVLENRPTHHQHFLPWFLLILAGYLSACSK